MLPWFKRGLQETPSHQTFTVLHHEQRFAILQHHESVTIFRWEVFTNCYQLLQVSQLWVRTSQSPHVCHWHSQLVLLMPLIESQTSSQFLQPCADQTGVRRPAGCQWHKRRTVEKDKLERFCGLWLWMRFCCCIYSSISCSLKSRHLLLFSSFIQGPFSCTRAAASSYIKSWCQNQL